MIGLGFDGIFHGLDVLLAAPVMALPLGTYAYRAALASAFLTGLVGVLAFDVAHDFARAVARRWWARRIDDEQGRSGKLFAAVSAVAVLTALLGPAWQQEASTGGGSVTGALLVVAAVRLVTRAPSPRSLRALMLLLGLAASHEPTPFALVCVASAAALAGSPSWRRHVQQTLRAERMLLSVLFVVGLAPTMLGLLTARRGALFSLPVPLLHGAMGVGAPVFTSLSSARGFFLGELGPVATAAAGLGMLAAIGLRAGRMLVAPVVTVALSSLTSMALLRVAPDHASSSSLVAIVLLHVMGAATLGAIVLFVANTKVPFAEASAAMVVVLELALPARAADETSTRRHDPQHARAASAWTDMAFGSAPVASVLLVADPQVYRRVVAARATASLRPDLLVVPTFDVRSRAGMLALSREPKLTALVRDLSLGASPEELSFAELAGARPVLATFDPRWDRALARHFVPLGLTSRFELEPRGVTDRKNALDAFRPIKDRLVQTVVRSPDPTLTALTATLLRARAVTMAACGERDLLSRALDDLRPFAPDDPTANTLVRRIVTTKGPIEIKDLAP